MEKRLSKDKEAVILHAAQGRFASYGYSKVTMDEIAEDIGMAKASLYYYFPTKESLFRSVVQFEQEEFLVHVKEVFEQKRKAGDRLLEYIRLRVKLTERLNNLSHFHQHTWHEVKPIFKSLFTAFVQQEMQCVMHVLQEGKNSGEFQLEHPQKIASMVLHVLQGLYLRSFRGYDQHAISESNRESYEEDTILFVNTILSGIRKVK